MTKEQIMEILKEYGKLFPITFNVNHKEADIIIESFINEILALQPTDEDIKASVPNYMDFAFRGAWMEGAKAMRNGEIKNNI